MRNVIRSPLTWMVLAELVVVGSLVTLAWTVIGSAARQAGTAGVPAVAAPQAAPEGDSPLPDVPTLTGEPARGPMPGLNLNPAFWRQTLVQLNHDQVVLVELEWRLVHGAMAAARDYVDGVVLPAIRRAEKVAAG